MKLAREFDARFVAVGDPALLEELRDALAGTGIECGAGESAIIEAAGRPADWVMAAVSGAAGLKPALAAVDRGATVALANKECLVCAGDFFMQRAAKAGACMLPADSEHNALFQALGSGNREELVRVIITASGGPFRTWAGENRAGDAGAGAEASELEHGPEDHDQLGLDDEQGARGDRGPLSVCAAPDEIDVLVHPQSIVHGMVEFPIVGGRAARRARHADSDRVLPGLAGADQGPSARLDLAEIGQLTFEAPDYTRFPGLRLAYDALRTGHGATTVFNAANEVAVAAFIAGKISSARSRGWSRRR